MKLPFLDQLDPRTVDVLLQLMERQVNSPLTSSCGRLFDCVAALLGIRQRVNYEAQAAIGLEMAIDSSEPDDGYPFDVFPDGNGWIIRTLPLFEALIQDLGRGRPVSACSRRFHDGLIGVLLRIADLLRQRTSLDRVCLSGGTFHNVYLLENLSTRLRSAGFEVFTHSEVPAGDGGLSLGQALCVFRSSGAVIPVRVGQQHHFVSATPDSTSKCLLYR